MSSLVVNGMDIEMTDSRFRDMCPSGPVCENTPKEDGIHVGGRNLLDDDNVRRWGARDETTRHGRGRRRTESPDNDDEE